MLPRWFIWMLLAVVCWGGWALLSKIVGEPPTPAQSQALSTLGILPVMAGLLLNKRPASAGSAIRGSMLAFAAGVLTCVGNIAYYAALNNAKAVTVVPLTSMYPLVTVLLAVVFLKEKLGGLQILGVLLSLLSIYLFNVQKEENVSLGLLSIAFIPIVLWGVAGLLQKVSTNSISGELSAFWFLSAFIPVAIFLLLRDPLKVSLPGKTWGLVILLGLTLALGNFLILLAFASHGKASVIAPVAGLYPLVSVPIAMLTLGERVGQREGLGIILALSAVAALSIEPKRTE